MAGATRRRGGGDEGRDSIVSYIPENLSYATSKESKWVALWLGTHSSVTQLQETCRFTVCYYSNQ